MLIILSPAKTMRCVAEMKGEAFWKTMFGRKTAPRFPKTTARLLKELLGLSTAQLGKVLEVSPALAAENKKRYDNWAKADTAPAAAAFDGPAYKGLQAGSLNAGELEYLQKHLRIVDPLHGMLRPMDFIKPYRLEMKTRNLEILKGAKGGLAKFWSNELTKSLIDDLDAQKAPKDQRFILDVASQEYSKVLDHKMLADAGVNVFTMHIEGSTFDAKYGRGAAARYCARANVATPKDLAGFVGAEDGSKCWAYNPKAAKTVAGKSMCFNFKGSNPKAAAAVAGGKRKAPADEEDAKPAPKAAKRRKTS